MRVLLVNDYGHESGGAETYVFALRDLLARNGHAVRLVADRARLIHYVSRVLNPWYLLKFLGICLAWRPDVIHVHKYNLVYSFMPALAGRLLGIRVVVTLHDVGLFCPDGFGLLADGSPCGKYLDRRCFSMKCYRSTTAFLDLQRRLNWVRNTLQVPVHDRTVSAFLCPSKYLTEWAAHYHGDRALHVPLFMPLPPEPPAPPPPARPLQVFFAGRLVAEKGLQYAIPALKGLPVELVIAGTGPYRPVLEEMARKAGVEAQVKWLGKIPNADVPRWIAATHAAILPSIWLENNPVFGYEAMKGARPILASKVGGLPDMVEEGVNGYLFPKGDVAGLQDALRNLLADAESSESGGSRIAEMGREGFAKARRDYDPEAHLARLLGIYAGGRGRRPA